MDPDVRFVDDRAPIPVCPFEIVQEVLDTLAETTRLVVDSLQGSTLPASLGRSISSVAEANGALFEQLSDVTRRFEPGRTAGRSSASRRRRPATSDRSADNAQPVLLRGKPGESATGAFVLQNVRPETVKATVLPTSFVDLAGDHADVSLVLEPSRVVLDPGQEVVVHVSVVIPVSLSLDQQLQGAIHVPGLTTSMVPVVIRAERQQEG